MGPFTELLCKVALSKSRLAAARALVHVTPSKAQQAAGNYAMGHVHWKGLRITIENPVGSTRAGVNKKGVPWSTTMKHDYGYFKGIKGKDKDHLDVFVGPHLDSELLHVINQVEPGTDKFDEHKVVVGCHSAAKAKKLYLDNYSDGWTGFHSCIPMTLAQFKKWTAKGKVTEMAEEVVKKAAEIDPARLNAVRALLASFNTQAQQQGLHFFATAEDPTAPGVGAETSAIVDRPDSLIRQHMALHKQKAKEHGWENMNWDPKQAEEQLCTVCKEPWSTCLGRHGSKPCACGSGKPRNQCDCPGGTPEKEAEHDDMPWPNKEEPSSNGSPDGLIDHMRKLRATNPNAYREHRTLLGVFFHKNSPIVKLIDKDAAEIQAPVSHVRQQTTYTCGPASLEAIIDKPEEEIAEEAGTSKEHGTDPHALLQAAQEEDPSATLHEDMTVAQLTKYLDQKRPVICDIQAWGDEDDYDELKDGHYVVAVGHDEDHIYFMDPSSEEQNSHLTKEELEERWKDKEDGGRRWDRAGIVFSPKTAPAEDAGETEKIAMFEDRVPIHLEEEDPSTTEAQPQGYTLDTSTVGPAANGPAAPHPTGGVQLGTSPDPGCSSGRTKGAAVAPGMGIPDRSNFGDMSKLQPGQLLDFIIQEHNAQKAGHHYDYRLGNPELGLYSWASRHELPEPGQRRAFYQQPVHAHAYGDFQGTLKGYGAGTVQQKRKGQILVTAAHPGKIEFTTADQRYPERYALIKPQTFGDKDWLLINNTPTKGPDYQKVHYTRIPKEQVEQHLDQIAHGEAQAKIDGASSLIQLLKDGVEITSYRTSKETGRPIVHTERVFGKRKAGYTDAIPKELIGSVLKGELYGQRQPGAEGAYSPALRDAGLAAPVRAEDRAQAGHQQRRAGPGGNNGAEIEGELVHDTGRNHAGDASGSPSTDAAFGTRQVISPQDLGGILNSTVANSLQSQRDQGVKLRVFLHNIQRFGKQDVSPGEVPYAKRKELLHAIQQHLDPEVFHVAEGAQGPEAAKALWKQVNERKHPLSSEGIVVHPETGKPYKAKITDDHDVHITGFFPGQGQRQHTVGGFTYSLQPGGPTVGRVGTGFSRESLSEFGNSPEHFVGRAARIRSFGQFPSGAHRAPAFIGLHEDWTPPEEKAAAAHVQMISITILREHGIDKHEEDEDEERPPIVAVDLDGTLAEDYETFDPDVVGEPRPGAIKAMKDFEALGWHIIINTVRGKTEPVEKWLKQHSIPYDEINHNKYQPADSNEKKICADLFIDDKGLDARQGWSKIKAEAKKRMKKSEELPYRDRVEMFGLNPEGKVLGGYYDDDKNHGVFGGGIEPGEKPEEAGAREFVEEAGYRLNKPRMLPFGPATYDWKPPYDSPMQAEKAKKWRGSRTFFGTGEVGDLVPLEERGSDMVSQLQNIRFRSLHTALRNTTGKRGMNPKTTMLRRAVLRHLMQEAAKGHDRMSRTGLLSGTGADTQPLH